MAGKIWRWFRGPRRSANVPIVVYTRADCPLCDHAVELLHKYEKSHDLAIELRDVDADGDLAARHGERVPVVFIAGQERFWGKINEALLVRTLNALR
jgi:glutaredoxin